MLIDNDTSYQNTTIYQNFSYNNYTYLNNTNIQEELELHLFEIFFIIFLLILFSISFLVTNKKFINKCCKTKKKKIYPESFNIKK